MIARGPKQAKLLQTIAAVIAALIVAQCCAIMLCYCCCAIFPWHYLGVVKFRTITSNYRGCHQSFDHSTLLCKLVLFWMSSKLGLWMPQNGRDSCSSIIAIVVIYQNWQFFETYPFSAAMGIGHHPRKNSIGVFMASSNNLSALQVL